MASTKAAAREAQAAAPSGDPWIDALLVGSRWSAATISYRDPDRGSDYGGSYPADDDGDGVPASRDGFAPLGPAQRQL